MFFSLFKKLLERKKINLNPLLKARLILIFLGTLFLFFSVFINEQTRRKAKNEVDLFNEPIKIEEELLEKKENGRPPIRLIIPELQIDVSVRQARVVKGFWEIFENEASFGLGSAYPGEVGNTVIFAHARPGLFKNLKDIKIGMNIYVLTNERWFVYKVEKITEVFPKQIEVIAPTPDETLTLYTCSGFADQERLIVIAKRIS